MADHYAFDRATKITAPATRYFLACEKDHHWERPVQAGIERTAVAIAKECGHANVRIEDIALAMHEHLGEGLWLDHPWTVAERDRFLAIRHEVRLEIDTKYVKTRVRTPTTEVDAEIERRFRAAIAEGVSP